jgi:hypothetical protein
MPYEATGRRGGAEPGRAKQAVVAGPGNSAVPCRADPSEDGRILSRLQDGATVDLVGKREGGWQSVRCGARAGFLPAERLSPARPARADASSAALAAAPVADAADRSRDSPVLP